MKNFNTFFKHFLGGSPVWFKQVLLAILIVNPISLSVLGPTYTGWLVLFEFIFILMMALKCYPLLPGGLLAIEVVAMGMVSPNGVYHEVENNLQVVLLLLFMVAGIYFMKDLLTYMFTKILIAIKSKVLLSLVFAIMGAVLSAWLDALTVTAVMIAVVTTFYRIYNATTIEERVPGSKPIPEKRVVARDDLENFNGFLRNLLMHGVIGTALGGVATMVGEPQNLLIATEMGWSFADFFLKMANVTLPIIFFGLLTTVYIEMHSISGYGYKLPPQVRKILDHNAQEMEAKMSGYKKWGIIMQAICAVWLILALAFHLAEVGFIGLSVIVILSATMGIQSEHSIGEAFKEGTPFLSLLIIFFVIVAMIEHNHLFAPIITEAQSYQGMGQTYFFFIASAMLSVISDNVFVASVYIKQAAEALASNKPQLEDVAMAINIGTNIPSIATPNGQAALLFLLTNNIAIRISLSYFRMMKMALPYFIVLTMIALLFLDVKWL
ncbi:sodium/proton antiporter [Fulvivirgaceae bacterium BMA12]|uniref:Sodium/proton antiporter n=1 Tax=Agaribacillus aureus TaxID=3051825 RepID=A0ABT8LCB4_9BACT|nr:sodium/proton antiporter [Fulvivirgaceae bacterium BMA12]